jgi:hypothetical protein
MAAIFEKAIERCRQQKFLEEVNASYAALKANRKKWKDEIAEIVRLTDGVPPGSVCPTFVFVLLSVIFSARRDELWGRFLTCGGLSIRLPPLDAPATPLENRHHSVCGLPLCGAGAFACQPIFSLSLTAVTHKRGYVFAGAYRAATVRERWPNGLFQHPVKI